MRGRAFIALAAILTVAGRLEAGDTGAPDKQPVYVGVRVCARCHADAATGHQFSRW